VESYKGDLVNSIELDKRTPDCQRMLTAYFNAAVTMNFIRASGVNMFTSHEALHIKYEDSLTRQLDSQIINVGAHLLWLGERTRKLKNAHVEYLSHINNPIGIKIGPNANLAELLQITTKLNPLNEEGKIILILRLGNSNFRSQLPGIVHTIKDANLKVTWMVDPMHANTFKNEKGIKTRRFETLLEEIVESCKILTSLGEVPGGIHLESSYTDVTEVVGCGIEDEMLGNKYETLCDPRLNYRQTIELLERVAREISS
jgi:3-deoxy-7-phosphoheptulonate synthase